MPSGKYARMDGGDEMGENKERFARENHSEVRVSSLAFLRGMFR